MKAYLPTEKYDSLSFHLGNLDRLTSLSEHPNLLNEIAIIARLGFTRSLDKVLPLIQTITYGALVRMHPDTLMNVARIVSFHRFTATTLDTLSNILPLLTTNDLYRMHPLTLQAITRAALLGSPSALNAVGSNALKHLTPPQFFEMGGLETLNLISQAGSHGSPRAIHSADTHHQATHSHGPQNLAQPRV